MVPQVEGVSDIDIALDTKQGTRVAVVATASVHPKPL